MSIPPEMMAALQQQQQGGGGAAQPAGKVGELASDMDLAQFVAVAKCSVLNSVDPAALGGVLGAGGAVRSDGDEQLLLFVEFLQKVKLREIGVEAAEAKEDDTSGPATVKVFVNAPHMDFSDAEEAPPTQTLQLKEEDLQAGRRVPLKFVKYQSVSSLTIFVESNQGDTDYSFLSRLRFFGQTLDGFNMNDLKPTG